MRARRSAAVIRARVVTAMAKMITYLPVGRQDQEATPMATTTDSQALAPFVGHRTALLTTFKRDGSGVDTPVTIAAEGDHAYMRTYDRAWKARRMRNNPSVRIAPATPAGKVRGE